MQISVLQFPILKVDMQGTRQGKTHGGGGGGGGGWHKLIASLGEKNCRKGDPNLNSLPSLLFKFHGPI